MTPSVNIEIHIFEKQLLLNSWQPLAHCLVADTLEMNEIITVLYVFSPTCYILM